MRSVRSIFSVAAQTARLMVGVPDYETYVEHRRTYHPGKPIMTYEEFFRERQNARYAVGKGKFRGCCLVILVGLLISRKLRLGSKRLVSCDRKPQSPWCRCSGVAHSSFPRSDHASRNPRTNDGDCTY